MKEFTLSAKVTISIYTKVEAETLEEAKEMTEGLSIEQSQFGYDNQANYAWVSDEYDGTPFDIEEIEA